MKPSLNRISDSRDKSEVRGVIFFRATPPGVGAEEFPYNTEHLSPAYNEMLLPLSIFQCSSKKKIPFLPENVQNHLPEIQT